jgi:hypothetical protein
MNKLSRGEICVANFIPPCEWCESPRAISCKIWHKKAIFGAKSSEIGHTKIALAAKVANFF